MLDLTKKVETAVVIVLLLLMLITVAISAIELAIIMYHEFMSPPKFMFGLQDLLEVLGFFLMVLIALELLATIRAYLEHRFHLEVVVVVAMIAIARKIIILDYKQTTPETLYGMGAVILALSVGFYLVKRAHEKKEDAEQSPSKTDTISPSYEMIKGNKDF
ncbi:phosphate-starvation-inducible E-like protein [candidate division KSB1 bacterium]|nr:phosphate-starvation-inducible PsiE family protein [candidate division KSB1 bacterium]RQW02615.1 MAG: phosphate-starvation-inducible E-like protein [candidate division KSB1 bacterium]